MMQRTQIYLPQGQLVRLRERARSEDTTVSDIIRTLLQKGLTTEKKAVNKHGTSLVEMADRVNALGQKGPRDLAENMDKYLYGSI